MADGIQELTVGQLQTPDGVAQLNNMLQTLYANLAGDGVSVNVYYGIGSPEGVLTAGIGSVYMRTDGTTNTSLYRKESGLGNTGWVATSSVTLPISVANGGTGADRSAVAQGNILYFSATGVLSNLGPGISGQFLQTLGAAANPLWATVSQGLSLLSTTTVSSAASTGNISLTSGKSYKVILKGINLTNSVDLYIRFNADSGANYSYIIGGFASGANVTNARTTGATQIKCNSASMADTTSDWEVTMELIPVNSSVNNKWVVGDIRYSDGAGNFSFNHFIGYYTGSATITNFALLASSGNITTTVWTYEYAGT